MRRIRNTAYDDLKTHWTTLMGVSKRRYPKEEMARRGEEIFEKSIKPKLKGRDPWDVVLIDIETGDMKSTPTI